jgi:putative hydrolase
MSQEPFGDIPLFRELQRLLASSEGPINYEIARQIGVAIATQGAPEGGTDPGASRRLADAVRACEVVLAGLTRLPLEEPMQAEVLGRTQWVTQSLTGWRWLLDHLAQRFTGQIAEAGAEQAQDQMTQALGQISPLLLGMQAGSLVGQLATESLSRYDIPIARDDDGHLFIVWRNMAEVAHEYTLDESAFVQWLALRECARHLIVRAVPWLARYQRSLLIEVIDAIEIDVSDIQRRFEELQSRGMEALQEGASVEQMIPITPTERHRRALGRLRAFLVLFEGYAERAADQIGPKIIGDTAKIDEGMSRRRASSSAGQAQLADLLGISVDRTLETAGVTFCSAVVELKGMATLNRVWEAPDNLPTTEEIKDPFAWIERVPQE